MIKRSKHGNIKVVDEFGQKFDSKREYKRFTELRLLEKAGQISNLQTQVTFEIVPKQKKPSGGVEHAVKYIADFLYTLPDGKNVIEDVKGISTKNLSTWVIKRKLMLYIHGIEVETIL